VAAPEYVPNTLAERPRRGLQLPPSRRDLVKPASLGPAQPTGPMLGNPGPDPGYALKLAEHVRGEIQVGPGEHVEDAVAGSVGVAMRRAASFGRAPVVHDLRLAFRIFGFLGDAPDELVAHRRPLFEAASHHYWDQREIVDSVPEETLRLSHTEVERRFPADWRPLLGLT
jgi:hypothetical protein